MGEIVYSRELILYNYIQHNIVHECSDFIKQQ